MGCITAELSDNPPPPEASRLSRLQRLLSFAVVITILALGGLAGALVDHYLFTTDNAQWDPLGAYPIQKVLNTQGFLLPGDTLSVDATKCVAKSTTKPVTVDGSSEWVSLLPAGKSVANPGGVATRYPAGVIPPSVNGYQPPIPDSNGCIHARYENIPPPEVVARSTEVCNDTGLPALWKIAGKETPVKGKTVGVERLWETQPFRIACAGTGVAK